MKIKLENVGVIKSADLEFVPGLNLIVGSSGSGKSTLMRNIYSMAMNEFADSDIAFGKNTMSITVENNSNTITYSRSLKSKTDKCYYEVNGEKFVKLGRNALPAVADTLKIGDLEINGEKINFNFNLQFSSPFLILGSQSTLYNVLTYRSSFDISSINDYYNADIKANTNDINANIKLKDKLSDSLVKLEEQANEISDIEKIYSNYMLYKHKVEKLNELKTLCNNLEQIDKLSEKINNINGILLLVNNSILLAEKIKYLNDLLNKQINFTNITNNINNDECLIKKYASSMMLIQKLSDITKLSLLVKQNEKCFNNINVISNCINISDKNSSKEQFIADIIRQYKLLIASNKCSNIISIFSKVDDSNINCLGDLLTIYDKQNAISNVNAHIVDVNNKCNLITKKLNEFDICPLCGNHIGTCNG